MFCRLIFPQLLDHYIKSFLLNLDLGERHLRDSSDQFSCSLRNMSLVLASGHLYRWPQHSGVSHNSDFIILRGETSRAMLPHGLGTEYQEDSEEANILWDSMSKMNRFWWVNWIEGMRVSGRQATGLAGASCIMRDPIISSTRECSRGHPGEKIQKQSVFPINHSFAFPGTECGVTEFFTRRREEWSSLE